MGKIVKYKIELEVLTPVHIAGADYKSRLNKTEYLFNPMTNELKIIDNNKFIDFLIEKKIVNKYTDDIKKLSLSNFLGEHKLYKDLNKFTKKSYKNLDIEFEDEEKKRLNIIKLLTKNAEGKVYIPGSSIKGALVNFLLVDYIVKNRNEFVNEINQIKKELEDFVKKNFNSFKEKMKKLENAENLINEIQKKILYEKLYDENSDKNIKKFGMSVSDSFKSKRDVKINFYQDIDEKIDDTDDDGKTYLSEIREYIEPKNTFEFDITLDFEMLSKTRLKINDFDDLINSLEKATNYLIENTLELPNELCGQNLILGANTGFHQKTIVHALFDDKNERTQVLKKLLEGRKNKMLHLNDKNFPRTINRIRKNGELKLAGLVKIRKISEKEVGK
ncbi:type III-A CRISPR-associated RAMP protein Csm5 [Leptotrichia buccalis]